MVLITALGIGVFAINDPKYALVISIFAAVTSWFWYKTNLGSKFWHESWEVEVVSLAKEQGIRSFERPTQDVIEQVRSSLEDASSSGHRNFVRRWLDKQILRKPSVSHYMILLSLNSTALWIIVSAFYAFDLIKPEKMAESIPQSAVNASPGPRTPEPAKPTPRGAEVKEAVTAPATGNRPNSREREGDGPRITFTPPPSAAPQ